MNNSNFMLSEIKSNVLRKFQLSEVDKFLKSGSYSNNKNELAKKLIELINTETKKYVKKLSKTEFEYLQYYANSIVENAKNTILATLYDDGYVAADAYVEYEIGMNIVNNEYSKFVEASEKLMDK